MGSLHGKITGHGMALGKGPEEDKHTHLVVVMTIKHRLILRYYSPLSNVCCFHVLLATFTFYSKTVGVLERGQKPPLQGG